MPGNSRIDAGGVLRYGALILRRSIDTQHNRAIGAHIAHGLPSRADAHGQHGNEHPDGASHTDDDGAHQPEARRDAGQIHAEQDAELFCMVHVRPLLSTGKRIGNLKPRRPRGWNRSTDQRDQDGSDHSGCNHDHRHGKPCYELRGIGKHAHRQRKPDERSSHAHDQRLGDDDQKHGAIGETQRLQHRKLGRALANRLHHHGGDGKQERYEHRTDDRPDGEVQIADRPHLLLRILLERRRSRFDGRIRECRVDGLGDGTRLLRIGGDDVEVAHRALVERACFIQVVVVRHDVFALADLARRESAHDLEGPGAGPVPLQDAGRERDPIPDAPSVFLAYVGTDQRAVPGLLKGFEVPGLYLENLRYERQPRFARPDCQHVYALGGLLIGAEKAVGEIHGLHAGDLLEPLDVGVGERRSAKSGGTDKEHIGAGPGNGLIHARLHALQYTEQREGQGDLQEHQGCAPGLAPDAKPDEGEVFHAGPRSVLLELGFDAPAAGKVAGQRPKEPLLRLRACRADLLLQGILAPQDYQARANDERRSDPYLAYGISSKNTYPRMMAMIMLAYSSGAIVDASA